MKRLQQLRRHIEAHGKAIDAKLALIDHISGKGFRSQL
jgi:hypothetical protein